VSITSTLVHRAEIRFHEAADVLRPYVGCFWVIAAERDATLRIVPDGSTSISIELQGRPSEWSLRGPLVRPEERRFTSAATLVGVRLRPGVAFLLSRIAADETVGRRLDVSTIPAFRELAEEDPAPQTPAQCIDVLQRFLIGRLRSASVNHVVAKALHEIERNPTCPRIGDIAARCQVSPRHLNRLMRIWVGYGPKRLARVVRFQTALEQIEQSPTQSGAALASNAGYFDQSHLTSDLARFAGATPGHLASRCVADFSKTRCDGPL
jgi:AraC-like DNA-binding protein